MLQMTPRARVPAGRFPPIPFVHTPRRALSRADERAIRNVLAAGDMRLPTDWPDMSALLELLDESDRPLPEGMRRRRTAA